VKLEDIDVSGADVVLERPVVEVSSVLGKMPDVVLNELDMVLK